MKALACILLTLALLTTGCQSTPGAGTHMLATYDKSGGIAGLDQRLIVRSDGSLLLHDRRSNQQFETTIDPGSLEPLIEIIHSSEFAAATRQYRGDPRGADLMSYTVEAQLPRRRHTVSTQDTAPHPPIIERAIHELERLAQLTRERAR